MSKRFLADQAIVEGMISVKAALVSKNREVHSVCIRKDKCGKEISYLESIARERGVKVKRVDAGFIEANVDGTTHGGIIAFVGERKYVKIEELAKTGSSAFVVLLEGIEDPFNFGYSIRSLYTAGVTGLIVPPRNWMSAGGTVTRSSAGTSEFIPIAIMEDADATVQFYKEHGFAVVCAVQEKDSVNLYDIELKLPMLLAVGGEKRGISKAFLKNADVLVQIPYGRSIACSLPTATAVSVIAFEVMRQLHLYNRAGEVLTK